MTTSPTSQPIQKLRVLGIESSCDDSAAAIVELEGTRGKILANHVIGQADLHAEFGGVVPEIAARAHAEKLDEAVLALGNLEKIDLVAVTTGPGLIGGLNAANAFARAFARARNIAIIGVNHLAGHALTPCLTNNLEPPFLMLLVSGGHCQFLIVKSFTEFKRLGTTMDDSPGEAFDKLAKILGLGYPGGPYVEKAAETGDPMRFPFPRPLLQKEGFDVSFSGLKSAARRLVDEYNHRGGMTEQDLADICAGFQSAIAEVLAAKSASALAHFAQHYPKTPLPFAVAGGVAANRTIKVCIEKAIAPLDAMLVAPPLPLCTDNAAMIAYAGGIKFQKLGVDEGDLFTRPRWPLDNKTTPLIGSGKKGAKV